MFLFCASILYLIAAILGVWSASLLWRAWHSWRLQRRGKRGLTKPLRIISAGRRRFGVGVALIALPAAGVAFALGGIVRKGGVESMPDFTQVAFQGIAAALVFLAIGAVYVAWRFDPSLGRRRCPSCWYDMSASAGRLCPECGTEPAAEKLMFRTRRAPRLAVVALLVLASAYAVSIVPRVSTNGWKAVVPTTALIAGIESWPEHFVIGMGDSLLERVRSNELWGWQRRYLSHRCLSVIETSGDLDAITRATMLIDWDAYSPGSKERPSMSRKATKAFLGAFKAAAIANAPNLPIRLVYTMSCLPAEFDESEIDDALAAINAGFQSTSPSMSGYAAMLVPRLGKAAAPLVAQLNKLVQSGAPGQRTTSIAFYALIQLAAVNDDAWQAYLGAFDSPDPEMRRDAIRYAALTGRRDDVLRQHLVWALGDTSPAVRDQAAYVIMQMYSAGCDAAAVLHDVLRSAHPEVVQAIIGDLAAKCQNDDVVAAVAEMLRQPSPVWIEPALNAAKHLGAAGGPLLPLLRRLEEPGAFQGDPALVRDAIEAIEQGVHDQPAAGDGEGASHGSGGPP